MNLWYDESMQEPVQTPLPPQINAAQIPISQYAQQDMGQGNALPPRNALTPIPQAVTPVSQPAQQIPQPIASISQAAQQSQQVFQQVPQIPQQPPQPIPQHAPRMKELGGASFDTSSIENVPGAQVVEQEPSPEISPELEGWMEKVERNVIKPPDQVVVADQTVTNPTGNYVSQPVIVLPTTQETIQEGTKQGLKQSVRWLAEWCLRIMKKFHGIVVYRDAVQKK